MLRFRAYPVGHGLRARQVASAATALFAQVVADARSRDVPCRGLDVAIRRGSGAKAKLIAEHNEAGDRERAYDAECYEQFETRRQ